MTFGQSYKPQHRSRVRLQSCATGGFLCWQENGVVAQCQLQNASTVWIVDSKVDGDRISLQTGQGTCLATTEEPYKTANYGKRCCHSDKATKATWTLQAAGAGSDRYMLVSAGGTLLLAIQAYNRHKDCVAHKKEAASKAFDIWTLHEDMEKASAEELHKFNVFAYNPAIQYRLPESWQTTYRDAARNSSFDDNGRLQIDVVSREAGVGKSALVNHLALKDASTVYHQSHGTQIPQTVNIDVRGIKWRLRDLPGQNGKHEGSKEMKEAHFVKRYKLTEDTTSAVMFVTRQSTRGGEAASAISKMVKIIKKACPTKPIFFVSTHANAKSEEISAYDRVTAREAFGILKDSEIPMFSVDANWSLTEDAVKCQEHMMTNRAKHDFPALLEHLGPVSGTRDNVIAQICIGQLVAEKVDHAVRHAEMKRFAALNALWTFSAHLPLGMVTPIYGPVIESITRNVAIFCLLMVRTGLISPKGEDETKLSAQFVSDIQEQMEKKAADLAKDHKLEGEEELKAAALRKQKLAGAGNVGRTAGLETLAVEGAAYALKGLKEVFGEQLLEAATTELTSSLAEFALDMVPGVGAIAAAAFAPVNQAHIVKLVKKLSQIVHQGWILQHMRQLWPSITLCDVPTTGLPVSTVNAQLAVAAVATASAEATLAAAAMPAVAAASYSPVYPPMTHQTAKYPTPYQSPQMAHPMTYSSDPFNSGSGHEWTSGKAYASTLYPSAPPSPAPMRELRPPSEMYPAAPAKDHAAMMYPSASHTSRATSAYPCFPAQPAQHYPSGLPQHSQPHVFGSSPGLGYASYPSFNTGNAANDHTHNRYSTGSQGHTDFRYPYTSGMGTAGYSHGGAFPYGGSGAQQPTHGLAPQQDMYGLPYV